MTQWMRNSFHKFGNSCKVSVIIFPLVLKYRDDFSYVFPLCLVGLDSVEVKVGRGSQRVYGALGTVLCLTYYHLPFKSAQEAGVLNHIFTNEKTGLEGYAALPTSERKWPSGHLSRSTCLRGACDHPDIRLCLPKPLESPFLSLIVTVAHTQREEHKISKSNCPHLRAVINHSYHLLSHLNWFTSPPHLSLVTLQDDREKSLSLLHHPSPPGLWQSPCSVEIP